MIDQKDRRILYGACGPAEITPGSFALVSAVRLRETGGMYSARIAHSRVACGACEQVGISFAVMPGRAEADAGGFLSQGWEIAAEHILCPGCAS